MDIIHAIKADIRKNKKGYNVETVHAMSKLLDRALVRQLIATACKLTKEGVGCGQS